MRRLHAKTGAGALLAGVALVGSCSAALAGVAPRYWTLADVVSAPQVTDLILTDDERSALYIVRAADAGQDSVVAELRRVDVATGVQSVLLHAPTIERLRKIPGTCDWSVLADLGSGVQLYRIDAHGHTAPLVVRPDVVLLGHVEGAVSSIQFEAPRKVGVLSYDWSPDGQWLWYTALRRIARPRSVRFDADVSAAESGVPSDHDAAVEYHVRATNGADRIVASRSASDSIARYRGGAVSWAPGEVRYVIEDHGGAAVASYSVLSWALASGTVRALPATADLPLLPPAAGPRGGKLATEGFGDGRLLVETTPDHGRHSYGRVDFLLNDPRSAGNWRSTRGSIAIVGTRGTRYPRYGLAVIDRNGLRPLSIAGSISRCDFAASLEMGVCVHEGQTIPPELVLVTPRTGSIRRVAPVSPRHEEIARLKVTPRLWLNRLGYYATGFIVWPRNYRPGRRYPALVITHGSDADERFANSNFQWNYPVQMFAERGYIVLLINDPAPSQSADLSRAFGEWTSGGGSLGPDQLQKLLWLNGVYCFESAVREMTEKGIVDPERVGIAGYSRGSQMVNVTITQSSLFAAASSGDGGYLEPDSFAENEETYRAVFGGSPYGPFLQRYQALSPSLRINEHMGAVLQQIATPYRGALAFDRALKAVGVPSQLTLYPGENALSSETHIFHIPSNRLLAMRENLAWFDFWLRQERDAETPFPERFAVWQRLADARPASPRSDRTATP